MSSQKLDKSTVLYVFNPPTKYQCSECAFLDNSKCTDYIDSEAGVEPYGSCNDWQSSSKGHIKGNGQRTREQTGYTENKAGFSCKRCEEFVSDTKRCKKVNETGGLTPGLIHPDACCNRWEADSVRAKLSDAEFKNLKSFKVK